MNELFGVVGVVGVGGVGGVGIVGATSSANGTEKTSRSAVPPATPRMLLAPEVIMTTPRPVVGS